MVAEAARRWWQILVRLRLAAGYLIFVSAVVYVFYKAPTVLWDIEFQWLFAAIVFIFFMLALQSLQVYVFLRSHNEKSVWVWLLDFAATKGVFNTVMPWRTGTLAVMYRLTDKFAVTWKNYLVYSVIAGVVAIVIAIVAFAFMIDRRVGVLMMGVAVVAVAIYNKLDLPYAETLWWQIVLSIGMYVSVLLVIWAILNGIGVRIGLLPAIYFATALNILAQISITPGNMGIREIVLGVIGPYVSLPISAGILAGAIFFVVRTLFYTSVVLVLKGWYRMKVSNANGVESHDQGRSSRK